MKCQTSPIFSEEAEVIRFGALISIQPLSAAPAGLAKTPRETGQLWCSHTGSFLFIHNQFEALSAASPTFLRTTLRSLPRIPSLPRALTSDVDTNPLHPTSIGKHVVFHPFSLHCDCRSTYLSRLRSWASSIRLSQGTVNSRMTTVFRFLENRTTSGLIFVTTISCGIFNCLPTSTSKLQSLATRDIHFGRFNLCPGSHECYTAWFNGLGFMNFLSV